MELFFFLFLHLLLFLAYFHSRQNPNVPANIVIAFLLMGLAANLFLDGLAIPYTGATFTDTTITYVSTTYGMENPWIFAIFWMYFVTGIVLFGLMIGKLASGGVNNDGTIR